MASVISWRGFLLFLCGLGVASVVSDAWPGTTGYIPIHVQDGRVIAAASKSGIQPGDRVELRDQSLAVRIRLYEGSAPAGTLPLVVTHAGTRRTVSISVIPTATTLFDWLASLSAMLLVIACVVIAMRQSQNAEARLLVLYILGPYVFAQFFAGTFTPWPFVDVALRIASALSYIGGFAALIAYASRFGRPLSLIRRVVTWLSAAIIAFVYLRMLVTFGAAIAGAEMVRASQSFWWGLGIFAPLLCLFWACRAAQSAERPRVMWATIATAPLLVFVVVVYWSGIVPQGVAQAGYDIGWCVTAVVIAYSLLNRRLLDVGFALNRAIVFSSVSLILVGTFVLVEWLLAEWMSTASHSTNIAVSGALALGLGLSMRFVHAQVERFVDNVIFRKRREDEAAIRRLAREAPYITDRDVLLARTVAVLERHADATFANVALRESWEDENDPAIVALRAAHEVLDLHRITTALIGDLAFPMVARGQLLGVLLLGPKRTHEIYAPDEVDAIRELAHSVAGAIDVLQLKEGVEQDSALRRIEALLINVVHRLPELDAR